MIVAIWHIKCDMCGAAQRIDFDGALDRPIIPLMWKVGTENPKSHICPVCAFYRKEMRSYDGECDLHQSR